jgi:hypothetical protein
MPSVDDVETVDEAKAAIAQLRADKQVLAAKKAEIGAQKSEENARWKERQAGRFRGVSRGFLGSMVTSSRRSERMEHVDRVNRLTAQQADLAEQMRDIDAEIRERNAFIRDQGPQPKAAPAPKTAVPSSAAVSHAERLTALAGLREAGLISDEEYATKRAEILESL